MRRSEERADDGPLPSLEKTRTAGTPPSRVVRWRLHDGREGKTGPIPLADALDAHPSPSPRVVVWSADSLSASPLGPHAESLPLAPITGPEAVWDYVEELRLEMHEAMEAALTLPRETEAPEDLVRRAEQSEDRWRTALDLALHAHPLVGRAEVAGARVGLVDRLRPSDWEGQSVHHVVFRAARGKERLATAAPERRGRVVAACLERALPELARHALPLVFCTRSEGSALLVHAYFPEASARACRMAFGPKEREALFLQELERQLPSLWQAQEPAEAPPRAREGGSWRTLP